MTETKFARSRRAAVLGLFLQLAACATCLGLSYASGSPGAAGLAWYILGGVPIWFVTLLVQRQKELAELEKIDFEALKREKGRTGEALFGGEGAAGLGYQATQKRLDWMLRWLSPAFGLVTALYLAGMGYQLWLRSPMVLSDQQQLYSANLPITLTILAVVMLLLFLMSRYSAGLGRAADWQMLRACGSYVFGNAIAAAVLLACLTVFWYAGVGGWERWFVRLLPVLMLLLAIEMLVNVVLDLYRPRKAGIESRAAFDSRLLGLFSEPGGIAASIADAINYQFGFEISQTWFYQLLQRTLHPLLWAGTGAIWLLSCLVIVYPGEHVIVERWGRQLNADQALGPGLHFKRPWPIDVGYRYDTGRLHELLIGFRNFDARPEPEVADQAGRADVVLWSQEKHRGQDHFDFLIYPIGGMPSGPASQQAPLQPSLLDVADRSQSVPVNLMRIILSVQYRIDPQRLADYTRRLESPEETLRNIAWSETVQFAASQTLDSLLGPERGRHGEVLRSRIEQRCRGLRLGLDVAYVGAYNVHPETTVAEAYRGVIDATQQRTNSIREALVQQSATLSAAAGDKAKARSFVLAMDQLNEAERDVLLAARGTTALSAPERQALQQALAPLRPLLENRAAAEEELRRSEQMAKSIEQEFEAGVGSNLALQARAQDAVRSANQQLETADRELTQSQERARARAGIAEDLWNAGLKQELARVKRDFWNSRLTRELAALEGKAAKALAQGNAIRWGIEMRAEAQVKMLLNERAAYQAAPRTYKIRRYFDTLARGLHDSRKFFLAFQPGTRDVNVRIVADDEASPDITSGPVKLPEK